MKRKDQLKVVLEILDMIDTADSQEKKYRYEYYDQVLERLHTIINQYPKDDPFRQIAEWLWNDSYMKKEDSASELS